MSVSAHVNLVESLLPDAEIFKESIFDFMNVYKDNFVSIFEDNFISSYEDEVD